MGTPPRRKVSQGLARGTWKGDRSSLHLLFQVCADKGQGARELTPTLCTPLWEAGIPTAGAAHPTLTSNQVRATRTPWPLRTMFHCYTTTLQPDWDKPPTWHYPKATQAEAQGTFWGHQLFRTQTRSPAFSKYVSTALSPRLRRRMRAMKGHITWSPQSLTVLSHWDSTEALLHISELEKRFMCMCYFTVLMEAPSNS